MNTIPKVAAVHDLSGFGRCSLTVVLPVLSAMGVQCCPVPTAVLSTHTGGFEGIARTDLTAQMEGTLRQWARLGLSFQGVYTGYMASAEQILLAARALEVLKAPGGMAVVDPVLGDHGRLYSSVTPEMAQAMKALCREADVIVPNQTEAALLLDAPAEDLPRDGEVLARMLSGEGGRSVVVTGIAPEDGVVGAAWYEKDSDRCGLCLGARVPGEYHGTGDLFSAVLTGCLVQGKSLEQSVARAVEFVRLCAARTWQSARPSREGVEFEPLLGLLTARD